MPRIAGIIVPDNKKISISLSYIYGVGRVNALSILKTAQVEPNKKAKDLTEQELGMIMKALESIPTEGVLRKRVSDNIQRLKQVKAYRGVRHMMRLPAHGQRTRSNARTRRGRRATVGAMTKDLAAKLGASAKK